MLRFMPVGSAASCTLLRLLVAWAAVDRRNECFVAGNGHESFALAVVHQFTVHLIFSFLFVRFIGMFHKLAQRCHNRFREARTTIAALMQLWHKDDVPRAECLRRFSVSGCPVPDRSCRGHRVYKCVSL